MDGLLKRQLKYIENKNEFINTQRLNGGFYILADVLTDAFPHLYVNKGFITEKFYDDDEKPFKTLGEAREVALEMHLAYLMNCSVYKDIIICHAFDNSIACDRYRDIKNY